MNEQRVQAIKDYINTYSNQFPEAELVVQLKSSGYTDEEINFAKSNQAIISSAPSIQIAPKKPFNRSKAIKITIAVVIALIVAIAGFWAFNTFLMYKGIKVGTYEINKVMENEKYEDIILKINKIESSKEKVKLYVSVENNMDDKVYNIYNNLLGSIKIKDKNGKALKDFDEDYSQEMGGDLDEPYISLEPDDNLDGYVSFINPDDKMIDSFTVEVSGDLFKKSEVIRL